MNISILEPNKVEKELKELNQEQLLRLRLLEEDIRIPTKRNSKIPWWVQIATINPVCIYYFGPFEHATEARLNQNGYIEDLVREKAHIVIVKLKQCLPDDLTIFVGTS